MSKDFEQAYKELAKSEAPDLWGRIEAGLSDRSSTQAELDAEPAKESGAQDGQASAEAKSEAGTEKKYLFRLRKYSAMAAAVICVIIVMPVLIRMNRSSQYYENDSSDESAAAEDAAAEDAAAEDTAAQEAGGSAEAAAEEEIMMAESSIAEESGEAESVSRESAKVKNGEITTESASDRSPEAAAGGAADIDQLSDSVSKETADESKKESSHGAVQEAGILSHVTVEITESKDVSEEAGFKENGTVYTAAVREDPEGVLAEGEEITVFIPAYSSVALAKGGVFELDLDRQEDKTDFYIVCGYYGWRTE